MYHLFSDVYVESERLIDRSKDTITISPQIGFEHVVQESVQPGTQLGYATSLEQLDADGFSALFGKAYNHDNKVMVYCDGPTYLRLYTLLVKALLPNLDLDTFKWIMLCKKATFNMLLSNIGGPATDVLSTVVINSKTIEAMFDFDDPFADAMRELTLIDPDKLSLEWRILRLITCKRVGRIPRDLSNILRRIALANTHDVLDVWGRILADPEHWDFAGCDKDTLLNADTVFEGCLNLPFIGSKMFLKPGLFDTYPSDDWLKALLTEIIPVLERCDEGPTAGRTKLILHLMFEQVNLYNPEVCLERVMTMFHGPKRLALPNRDAGKYDENLIRFILSTDAAPLKVCVEGAEW
jgi:hypothetical protein